MKETETKIVNIRDFVSEKNRDCGDFSGSYRYSSNLTNPIMKKNFLISVKEKTHTFNVSDLFN